MKVSIRKTITSTLAVAILASSLAVVPAEARNGRKAAAIAGVLGALALGALAVGAANGGYGYGDDCWVERRPVYDDWGNVRFYRRVRICN